MSGELKLAIALTGGIATGKSSISILLKLRGFAIIDADKVSHEVLAASGKEVAELFGPEYLTDGAPDRKKLGQLVFARPEERKKLERLLHPKIREEIFRQAALEEAKGYPYFIDIPLFFETGAYPIEKVLVVYATREQQIARVMERDGLTEEQALGRIDAQADIETKKAKATWLIDNSGDVKQLTRETERVVREIHAAYQI